MKFRDKALLTAFCAFLAVVLVGGPIACVLGRSELRDHSREVADRVLNVPGCEPVCLTTQIGRDGEEYHVVWGLNIWSEYQVIGCVGGVGIEEASDIFWPYDDQKVLVSGEATSLEAQYQMNVCQTSFLRKAYAEVVGS